MEERTPEQTSIIASVCKYYGITKEQMLGQRRQKHLVKARQASYWLYENLTDFSYPRIGLIHKRDHTTVLYGCSKITEEINNQTVDGNHVMKLYHSLRLKNEDQIEMAF